MTGRVIRWWIQDDRWFVLVIVAVVLAAAIGVVLLIRTTGPPSHGDLSLTRAKEHGAATIANSGVEDGQNFRVAEAVKSSYAGTAAWLLRYEAPGHRPVCVWVWRVKVDLRSATGSCP